MDSDRLRIVIAGAVEEFTNRGANVVSALVGDGPENRGTRQRLANWIVEAIRAAEADEARLSNPGSAAKSSYP
jgi:hypothetical protein